MPESRQSALSAVRVHIPHVLHHLLSLVNFKNIETVVDMGVEVIGNMVKFVGEPPKNNSVGEHKPESEE